MLKELVGYFLIVAVWTSLLSGLFNAALYYGKGFLKHKPTTGEENLRLIVSSLVFGFTSMGMTMGAIGFVAILTYPLFQAILH